MISIEIDATREERVRKKDLRAFVRAPEVQMLHMFADALQTVDEEGGG